MNSTPSFSNSMPYDAWKVMSRGIGAGLLLRRLTPLSFVQGAIYGGLSGTFLVTMEKTEAAFHLENSPAQFLLNTTLSWGIAGGIFQIHSRMQKQPAPRLPIMRTARTAFAIEAFILSSKIAYWFYEEQRTETLKRKLIEKLYERVDA